MRNLLCISLLTFCFSCTKVIRLKLADAPEQLDIEANITDKDTVQQIVLRRDVAFTASNDYPPVTGADVSLADDAGNLYVFSETKPGTYGSTAFAGKAGATYTLKVRVDGQDYSAASTMPSLVRLDSLSDQNRPLNRHQDGRDQKVIIAHYQDPPGVQNQYRFIEWVNGIQVKSVFTYDDQLTDGRPVSFDLLEQDLDIYPGDTVTVEMQCIDRQLYTYWFALESQQANNFNGAVAPANPPTNISPARLGYFSAHTTRTLTMIVK